MSMLVDHYIYLIFDGKSNIVPSLIGPTGKNFLLSRVNIFIKLYDYRSFIFCIVMYRGYLLRVVFALKLEIYKII